MLKSLAKKFAPASRSALLSPLPQNETKVEAKLLTRQASRLAKKFTPASHSARLSRLPHYHSSMCSSAIDNKVVSILPVVVSGKRDLILSDGQCPDISSSVSRSITFGLASVICNGTLSLLQENMF